MNKKADVFEPLMVIFLIILLSFAIKTLVYDKAAERDRTYIGETSLKIAELDNKAKLTTFLIENAARSLYHRALDETAKQGGGCEDWSEDCELDAKKAFFQNFNNLFNDYIGKLGIATDYIYEEKEGKLEFKSKGNLKFMAVSSGTVSSGVVYSIPHSFEIDFNYDFNIYTEFHKVFNKPEVNCEEIEKKCEDLNLEEKCICSIANNYINVKLPTKDLVFVKPIIQFKLGVLKHAQIV